MDTHESPAWGEITTPEMTNREDRGIWPGLSSDDAPALRRWLAALGFAEGIVVPGDSPGEIRHSEMLWPEGGRVMVSSRGKSDQTFVTTGAASLYVVTRDPDAVHARATAQRARLARELRDEDYGSRGFSVIDPDGNTWSFGTYAGDHP